MSDDRERLISAARQLLAVEELLGGEYLPVGGPALPEIEPPAPPAAAAPGDGMTRRQKTDALAAMDREEVSVCTKCRLSATRTNTVFGEGEPDADLVFVGEGPGADEDAQGRPFVGKAGKLLDRMIAAMGLSRDGVFICNMVKCRPPENRDPARDEVESCWPYLVRQLEIIRPRALITMGNPATKGLLNTTTGITRMRGRWAELPDIGEGLAGTPVMPTFHPSYVARYYTPDIRRAVWSDLQQVMDFLGLARPDPHAETGG
jgi:DNA polymerase